MKFFVKNQAVDLKGYIMNKERKYLKNIEIPGDPWVSDINLAWRFPIAGEVDENFKVTNLGDRIIALFKEEFPEMYQMTMEYHVKYKNDEGPL